MDTGLKGKTVLITGASRNMGRLAAIAFAKEGANLAICTSTKMKELEDVAAELRAIGAKVVAERCDVSKPDDVNAFARKVKEGLGTVHVLLNNAVYRGKEAPLLEETDEAWMLNFAVNLTGPRNVCRAVLPMMIEQRWGRIINFCGISPYTGSSTTKGMAKLGIVGFTRGLAREFSKYEITANCVGPGSIEVERDAFQKPKPLRDNQPIPRKGRPEEVVATTIFLASEGASYITGQAYLVNGGAYFQ